MIGKTIDQINVGDSAFQEVLITEEYVETFGKITNDFNPAHFDGDYASKTIFKKRISHGMYVGSLFSKVFGMDLPGNGAIYITQNLRFRRPVYFGDTIKAEVTVKDINVEKNRVYFDCIAYNQNNEKVIIGDAELMPPVKKGE
jgi:acyl dehydratase